MLRTYDPADSVSPELSEVLESLATGDVGEAYDADRLHPETMQTLLTELTT